MKTSTSEQQHSVLTDIVVRSKYEIHRWLSRDASRSLKALPKPDHLSSMIRRRHLRKYYTTFGTVVDLLEARDIYTADHSKRVVTLCFRLCMLTRMTISTDKNSVIIVINVIYPPISMKIMTMMTIMTIIMFTRARGS